MAFTGAVARIGKNPTHTASTEYPEVCAQKSIIPPLHNGYGGCSLTSHCRLSSEVPPPSAWKAASLDRHQTGRKQSSVGHRACIFNFLNRPGALFAMVFGPIDMRAHRIGYDAGRSAVEPTRFDFSLLRPRQ